MLPLLLALLQQTADPPQDWIRIGGRLQADLARLSGEGFEQIGALLGEDFDSTTRPRRLRLRVDFLFTEEWLGRVEYDFASGDAQPRAVTATWRPSKGGEDESRAEYEFGFHKMPSGFERLLSSNDFDLAEEAPVEQSLTVGRQVGASARRWRPEWSAQAGVYRVYDNRTEDITQAWGMVARAVWRPFWNQEARELLHLGLTAGWENPDGMDSFAADVESDLIPNFLVGSVPAERTTRLAAEAAWIRGSFHGHADLLTARTDDPDFGNAFLNGWTAAAGWYLTGESRAYRPDLATFDRTHPRAEFGPGTDGAGLGAWEVAARVSSLDFGEAALPGLPERLDTWSAGLVWHWSSHLRWLLTYTRADLGEFAPMHLTTLRFAVDF